MGAESAPEIVPVSPEPQEETPEELDKRIEALNAFPRAALDAMTIDELVASAEAAGLTDFFERGLGQTPAAKSPEEKLAALKRFAELPEYDIPEDQEALIRAHGILKVALQRFAENT